MFACERVYEEGELFIVEVHWCFFDFRWTYCLFYLHRIFFSDVIHKKYMYSDEGMIYYSIFW